MKKLEKRETWEYFVFMSVIWKLKDYDVGGTWGAVGWRTARQANKFAVSILDGVIKIVHWHNRSGSTIGLGSTQPLIKAVVSQDWQPYNLHMSII